MASAHFLSFKVMRFLLVGGLNTAVAYGAYALFLFMGLTYASANFLALIVGIGIGFKTQGILVFQNSDNRLFVRFVVFWVAMYLLNIGLIAQLMSLGLNAYAAGAVTFPLIATLSFVVQNSFVFKRAQNGSGASKPHGAQNGSGNVSGSAK